MLVNRPILPAPWDVFTVFIQELGNGLVTHFFFSFWRVTAGMLLSVLVAAPVGLAIGGSKQLDRIFSPIIYLLYPIPKVVFVPVVLLFLGNRRCCQDHTHLPDPVFPDRGAGA